MKKIIFFGDAIGKPGRKALLKVVPEVREKYQPDFIIANVENLAHGKGVTMSTLGELDVLKIDAYTGGNHIFEKRESADEVFEKYSNIVRPGNYLGDFPGKGWVRIEKGGQGYLIISLNAKVFFPESRFGGISSPFAEFDNIIVDQKRPGDIVFVDFHSEVSSEKKAFGFYVDGKASLVCGTHTHTPTADLRILPKGTGHVSDVGMIGAVNSVLGVPIENSMQIFLGGKFVYEVEESNPIMVNAVYAEIDENGLATKVEKFYTEVNV
jgi:metallophosphoesterase (TIGR00282 family)